MDKCNNCQNLYYEDDIECCFIYGDPNHDISDCEDWIPLEGKRGYEVERHIWNDSINYDVCNWLLFNNF